MTNAYKNRGYAYANVVPNSGTREEDRLVDIELVIEPGELVYIEWLISVVPAPKTR